LKADWESWVEEEAARAQKTMAISEKKVKDFEDLETILKLKMTEREKQKRQTHLKENH